jgi:hypothetical protein
LNHQGLGPGTGGSATHPYFTHGGANEGYRCNLVAYNEGDGVVIMTNGDNGGQLANEVQRTVAREYGWPDFQPLEHTVAKVDPKVFDGLVGKYELAPGFILTITREGDTLFSQATGQGRIQMFPESERDYFVKVVDAQVTFVTDGKGRATELILHQGADHPAKRVE